MSDESLVHASGLPAGEAGAATVAPQAPEPVPGVVPSAGCGCESCRARAAAAGGGTESGPAPGSLVFALGQLDYDLVSDTRRYSLQQHIWEHRHQFHGVACDPSRLPTPAEANPHDPEHLLDYLEHEANCWDSAAVQWVLKIRQTPIYAIQPWGPFAREIYAWLRTTLREHMTRRDEERVEWVSIPGRLAGQAKLFNGQYVPVIIPEPRGLYSWNLVALLRKLIDAGKPEKSTAGKPEKSDTGKLEKIEQVREFLDRVYHDLRNLGLTSRDRALNYAATNAAQVGSVFDSVLAAKEPMALDSIDAAPSPECLPGADCWDVKIHFFYPERPAPSVRKVYSFTVDVSDMVPVMVGPRRSWHER